MQSILKSLKCIRLNIIRTSSRYQRRQLKINVNNDSKKAPASLLKFGPNIRQNSSFTGSLSVANGSSILRQILVSFIIKGTRKYAPNGGIGRCWNCQAQVAGKNEMLCSGCGHLQDICLSSNYFDLMDFPQSFDIKLDQLTRRFRQLQTLVHPDKFSNKSEREQRNSADWSALINKAYKTLMIPIERGEYLLQLNGVPIPEDNSALDSEFLMEMMERNEEIEEASSAEELNELNNIISREVDKQIESLSKAFNENDLNGAKNFLVKMKYFLSMQRTLKTKLQSISDQSLS